MRAFVLMRQFALTYQELSEKLIELEKLHTLLRCSYAKARPKV
jgi:hypothetical protein